MLTAERAHLARAADCLTEMRAATSAVGDSGGDRGLVDDVLADRRLAPLAALRREPHLDVGEPTKAVLLETPKQFRAVDVTIVEPADRPA